MDLFIYFESESLWSNDDCGECFGHVYNVTLPLHLSCGPHNTASRMKTTCKATYIYIFNHSPCSPGCQKHINKK